jgi:hypothetical protein
VTGEPMPVNSINLICWDLLNFPRLGVLEDEGGLGSLESTLGLERE